MKAKFADFNKTSNWVDGYVGPYHFSAKLFDLPSHFGIDNGRVSKLGITTKNSPRKTIVNYDRGWDIKPKSNTLANEAYMAVLKLCENSPKRFE